MSAFAGRNWRIGGHSPEDMMSVYDPKAVDIRVAQELKSKYGAGEGRFRAWPDSHNDRLRHINVALLMSALGPTERV